MIGFACKLKDAILNANECILACFWVLIFPSNFIYIDEADGAHVGVDELEPGVALGDSNCTVNNIQPETVYTECIHAMNYHMMASMTTNAVRKSALFCHQMIPHHQNAINMAKALMHTHDIVRPFGEGDDERWECELAPILYDIINGQNAQIMTMTNVLDQLCANQYENCEVGFTMTNDVVPLRHLREPEFMKEYSHRLTREEERTENTHVRVGSTVRLVEVLLVTVRSGLV